MYDVKQSIDFTGKTVIITGGSKGIGEGCTRVFCSAGANVVFCSRGEEAGKKLEKELNTEYGRKGCVYVQCDVRKEEEVKNVINVAVESFGHLNCLINNAGVHPGDETIDEVSVDMFNGSILMNLTSMFMFCKFALPHLRMTKGSIINMSSLVGSMGQKMACRYVTTKGGINGLTKALAIDEAKYGVRVNSVMPGLIDTPLTDECVDQMPDPDKLREMIRSWTFLKRQGSVIETGMVCLFLASDLAAYMTGVEIPVSGGAELGYGAKY